MLPTTKSRAFMWVLVLGTTITVPLIQPNTGKGTENEQVESRVMLASDRTKGNSANGKAIFDGKGYCFQCHGRDGYIDQRPAMNPEIDRMIKQLTHPPANLRKPESLKSKNDAERFLAIKEGHSGTAMLPKKDFLTDKEIDDLVAYLSTLRSAATASGKTLK